jgi:adenylate kinase family enzyme
MDEAAAAAGGRGGDDADADDGAGYGSRIFLVDGFPRNYDNVRGWMECMPSHASVLGALVYDCPMEELERRILGRAETSGRSDDNLESARRRFDTFRMQTVPVVKALERAQEMLVETDAGDDSEEGRLGGGGGGGGGGVGGRRLNVVNIDGSGSVEDVWKATKAAMDAYVKNDVLTANSNLLKAIEDGDIVQVMTLSDDDELLEGLDPIYDRAQPTTTTTMTATMPSSSSLVSNGRVDVVDGIKAIVSYDRKMKGGMKVRETRVWKHGPAGWKCVGVTRV